MSSGPAACRGLSAQGTDEHRQGRLRGAHGPGDRANAEVSRGPPGDCPTCPLGGLGALPRGPYQDEERA
ncbi:hypothetical protein [Streptomyces sp. NPDC051098]|uniref:hypothetical protein n=1 Tax=Streptomyces sp. NPDC051098 TaxID=3155411 RepID=UPI0034422CBD